MKRRVLALILCTLLVLLSGCHVKDKKTGDSEVATGSQTNSSLEKTQQVECYVPNEIELPWEDKTEISDMCKMQDGSMVVVSENRQFCISKDEGKTWSHKTNEELNRWYDKISSQEPMSKFNSGTSLSTDGQMISWDITNMSEEGMQHLSYWYHKPGENPVEKTLELDNEGQMIRIWFSEDGKLYLMDGTAIHEITPNSGEKKRLCQTESPQIASSIGSIIVVCDSSGVCLFDCETGEFIERDKVLDEFVQKVRSTNVNMLFEQGENNSFYILCREGLYRHTLGGSSIEQVIKGETLQDSNVNTESVNHILIPKTGEFLLPSTGGLLIHYSYGKIDEPKPKTTLTVYNLMTEYRTQHYPYYYNDYEMPLAIKKYKKLNPEVDIEYTIGIDPREENTVPVKDVIKNLNIEMAAGKGPDILLLDGLPVDTYIEKGFLTDISDIVSEVDEEEGILDVVKKNYTREDGSIYQIPLGFTLNMIYGPKGFVEKATDLTGLVEAVQEQNKKNLESEKKWVLDMSPEPINLIQFFSLTCMHTWITEKGQIREENLLKFYTQLEKLYDVVFTESNPRFQRVKDALAHVNTLDDWIHMFYHLSDVNKILTYAKYVPIKEWTHLNSRVRHYSTYYADGILLGELGHASSSFAQMLTKNANSMNTEDYAVFHGQSKNVYNPKRIIGINALSNKQSEAKEFVRFLLSYEANYGANTLSVANESYADNVLFSVNKKRLEEELKKVLNYKDATIEYDKEIIENSKEEDPFLEQMIADRQEALALEENVDKLKGMIDAMERPSMDNRPLLNAVTEAGANVLWGDYTPERAVEQVQKKMELYLME